MAADPAIHSFTSARVAYWDNLALNDNDWSTHRNYQQQRTNEIYSFLVPSGMRVLELGCGRGDLLARVKPAYGVGVDFSSVAVGYAKKKYPLLHFEVADIHDFNVDHVFDYILLSDVINDVWDIQRVLKTVVRHSHPGTRIIANFLNSAWVGLRNMADALRVTAPRPRQTRLKREHVRNLLTLADLEIIRSFTDILCPFKIYGLETLFNRYFVKLPPFCLLGSTVFFIARLQKKPVLKPPVVSVVVPARNESGNISRLLDEMPTLGAGTELIFVEGHSTDDTYAVIAAEIIARATSSVQLFRQTGIGKADAVRLGFSKASGELLMILDADLTVSPADLERFYECWRSGMGEVINGVRLVYPTDKMAMRFVNRVGNRLFSYGLTWLLGQRMTDTLCGTKVLSRKHYDLIVQNRSYGDGVDPFGDFDLLIGAAKQNLKIIDMPIRYGARCYGNTNIRRWRHGLLLLRTLIVAVIRDRFV